MSGKFQNEDHKTEAELISAGGVKAQLLNDTKVYLSTVAETLDDAYTLGKLSRPGVVGSVGTPQTVTTDIDITTKNTFLDVVVFVVGSGPVSILIANILGGLFVGQKLTIIGTSDTNTVEITDGVNGPIVLGQNVIAQYVYNGTIFVETGRNQ